MAAPISFDDLIPQGGNAAPQRGNGASPATPLSFDDLIPQGRDLAAPSGDPIGDLENMSSPGTQAEPWSATGQRVDDLARLTANGATLGFADKLAGTFGGDTKLERAKTADAADRAGPVGTLASGVGAMLPAGAAARGVGALGDLFGVGSTIARGAATGAAVGAGDAVGHDQPVLPAAASGAAIGGAVPAVVGVASRLAGMFAPPSTVAPTSDQLRAAAQDAYQAAWDSGAGYSPQAVQRLSASVRENMNEFGYAPELQPGGSAVVRAIDRLDQSPPPPEPLAPLPSDPMQRAQEFSRRLNTPPAEPEPVAPASIKDVDITRRLAGNMYTPTNPSAGALGGRLKSEIDDFLANPQPGDIVAGDGQDGVGSLLRARQLYQRSSKDQDLAAALDRGELQAGTSGSGGNINNATRQRVSQLYQGRQDWTPDEDAALRAIVMGTPMSNTLRQIGKLSPEGNGLMAALSLGGGIASSGATLPANLAGFVAKRAADRMTLNAADRAGQLMRVGGDATSLLPTPTAAQMTLQGAGDPVLQAILAGRVGMDRPGVR